jgi:putative PIN family toxin of toxin-antitoxin system
VRVLVDTNVFVSRLLVRSRASTGVSRVIRAAVVGEYTLLVPEEVLDELHGLRDRKPYLRDRITERDIDDLIHVLRSVAVILPRSTDPVPAVLRDPKYDFLLTAATLGDADYLVTGDRDLTDIREHLERPRILTVADFLELLPPERTD